MFSNTLDNKRYHTLNYYYKKKYGTKVFKVSLNGGFSCPNKDGSKGKGGCIFCSKLGSGDFAGESWKDLVTQFNEVKDIMHKKWPEAKYIGYFQANTNTYAPLEELKEKYETILNLENVVGLNISTRSDAITPECFEYLSELNKKTDLTVEIGLQSMHESTLKYINRGHDLKNFEDCIKELKKRNIKVVVHIINGIPGETKEMMIETAKYLNDLKIDGIKIHMLHVIENTYLGDMYKEKPFPLLTKEEYIDIVISQLEYLDENIVINRITGDPVKEDLIAPSWLLKKFVVLNDIDKEMVKRDTYQGAKVIE